MEEQKGIPKKKLNKKSKRMKKIKRSLGLFIAPSFLGILIFFVNPFLAVLLSLLLAIMLETKLPF